MPQEWSLRRRVLVASGLAIAVALAFGVMAFTVALDRILTNAATDAATVQANQIASVVGSGEYTPTTAVRDLPAQGSLIQFLDSSGRVVAASDASAATTAVTSQRPAPGQVLTFTTPSIGDEAEPHVVAVRSVLDASSHSYTLVVATPLNTESRTVRVSTALLTGGATVLVGGLLYLIHRILGSAIRPVERIRREVAAITRAGSTDRVSVPATGDEIAHLAETMNAMLERLARADAATRRFISDASHELRSPLATLRATLETAPDQDTAENGLMRNETIRMQHLVDDLLTLAKADDQGLKIRHLQVDLDDVVGAEVARLRALTSLPVHSTIIALRVLGDSERLTQILRNLTDNAARHARASIRVTMERDDEHVRVHVDNDGDPVPVEMRDRIFDRFARLDDSRERDSGGSGLGLPIARALAQAHGGTVSTGEAPDGSCRFTLTLPDNPPEP